MGMKILMMNMSEDTGPVFGGMLQRCFERVARPGATLEIRSNKPGLEFLNDAAYRYEMMVHGLRVTELALQAQKDGFDAIVST